MTISIPKDIINELNADIMHAVERAAYAHVKTERKATVTIKLVISKNKDTHKRQVVGKVVTTIPDGAEDSVTRKSDSMTLLSVSDDHPGQTRIGEDS